MPDWRRARGERYLTLLVCIVGVLLVGCRAPPSTSADLATPPPGAATVKLFVEPDEGVQPVVRFLNGASQSLDVAMYLLSDRDVIGAIESAQRRGVRVRVMLEEHPYGTGPGNGTTYKRLRDAKVEVNWSPANFQLSHDKYAVADRKTSMVGTANWTLSAFANNREYLLVDDDPTDVSQLTALFDADWNRTSASLDDPRLVLSPTNSRKNLLGLIGSARRSLDLEAEEMQDSQVETALGQAAKRGVAVRVILPAPSSGGDSNAAGEARIAADGVQTRTLRQPYVHAKDLIVDGQEAFVGSENLSTASLDSNREVGLLLSDPAAIQRLASTFARDWEAGR